jgi:hypothetical protein
LGICCPNAGVQWVTFKQAFVWVAVQLLLVAILRLCVVRRWVLRHYVRMHRSWNSRLIVLWSWRTRIIINTITKLLCQQFKSRSTSMVERLTESQRHSHREYVETCGVLRTQEHMMISTARIVFGWSPRPKWIPSVDSFILILKQKVTKHQEGEVLQQRQGFELACIHI